MTIGPTLKEGLSYRNVEQLTLGLETSYSPSTVSKWTSETRTIPKEVLPKVNQYLDYPELYLETALEATGGVALPVLDGDYITRMSASMKDLVQKETNEALETIHQIEEKLTLFKPPKFASEMDKQDIKELMREVLESATSQVNFVAVLCREYDISMKDVYRTLLVKLKSGRLRK